MSRAVPRYPPPSPGTSKADGQAVSLPPWDSLLSPHQPFFLLSLPETLPPVSLVGHLVSFLRLNPPALTVSLTMVQLFLRCHVRALVFRGVLSLPPHSGSSGLHLLQAPSPARTLLLNFREGQTPSVSQPPACFHPIGHLYRSTRSLQSSPVFLSWPESSCFQPSLSPPHLGAPGCLVLSVM